MEISPCTAKTNEQKKELASHGTAAFPIACYLDDLWERTVSWHWHEELEFAVVTKGALSVSAGNSVISLGQGEGIFLNRGTLHQMQKGADTSCLLRSLVFHSRLVGGGMDSVFWQKYLEPLLFDACFPFCVLDPRTKWQKEVLLAAEKAWISCTEETPGYEFSVRDSLSRLLYLLFSNRPSTGQNPPSPKKLRESQRVKQMLQYIHEHSSEELTVPLIAKSALVSDSECLRCFKNTIGVSPIRYVKEYRLQKAAKLLCSSHESVASIAALCGFQDMSYFSRAFREKYSRTPSAYRNAQMPSSNPLIPSSSKISR